jgi:hypothetical protein
MIEGASAKSIRISGAPFEPRGAAGTVDDSAGRANGIDASEAAAPRSASRRERGVLPGL